MNRIPFLSLTIAVFLLLTSAAALADDVPSATGTVLSADGKPVDGAEVIAVTPEKSAWPNVAPEKRPEFRRGALTTRTDASGHFTIPLPPGAGLLSIHHPKVGYAEVKPASLANDPQVKLDPWCRVEGTFKIGTKPAPAETRVTLGTFGWNGSACRIHYGYNTSTDAQGHYVLDRVPSGVVKIQVQPTKDASTVEMYTSAEAGNPTHFDIGGAGRPVIGKLVFVGGLDLKLLFDRQSKDKIYSTSVFRRDVPWPSDQGPGRGSKDQEKEDVVRAWRKTPEAIAAYKDEYRGDLEFQRDGSFRFDDVPPGKYKLSLEFYQNGDKGGQTIAELSQDVIVPDAPVVPSDEPLDLGELKVGAKGL